MDELTKKEKQFLIETLVAIMRSKTKVDSEHYTITISRWELEALVKKLKKGKKLPIKVDYSEKRRYKMLKNNDGALCLDPISIIIGQVNGNEFFPHYLDEGVVLRPDFGSSVFLPDYEHYPENLSIGEYGVCDNYMQILDQCPELQDPNRIFLITLTPIKKEKQSPKYGWRWHKWGEYIGKKLLLVNISMMNLKFFKFLFTIFMKRKMAKVELLETQEICPKCSYTKNKMYFDFIEVKETMHSIEYQKVKNFICCNENCGHRWEKI